MSRFCLPAYMRVLVACKKPGTKKQDVDTDLFDLISPSLPLVDASQASGIRSGGKKLPTAPHDAAGRADAIQVASRMREYIDEYVDPNKLGEAVAAVRFLLLADPHIAEDERIGYLTGFTKANYRACSSYEAATVLAELLLYCCRQPREDIDKADLPSVDDGFLEDAYASSPITLSSPSSALKATLNNSGFDDTFCRIGSLSLQGGRSLEVYLLNELGSEGFDYSMLIEFLETNLGEYCL